jgi:hypothetical protein
MLLFFLVLVLVGGATSFSRAWPMTFSLKPLAAADAAIAQKP